MLSPSTATLNHEKQVQAYLGDLYQKEDLVLFFDSVNSAAFLYLITAESQAAYLLAHRRDLVPPDNPNGTHPSPHSIATAFEVAYSTLPTFRAQYLRFVREHY
jgi:hypothetical protein